MTDKDKIGILRDRLTLRTSGLRRIGQRELHVDVSDGALIDAGEEFLNFVIEYIVQQRRTIAADETLEYGCWLVMFKGRESDNYLEIWEYGTDGKKFVPGIERAVVLWQEQHRICESVGAGFSPPRADKLAVISEGVIEGEALEGIRYPAPEHMSGWWFLTARYKSDKDAVRSLHLFHVIEARPELAQFLALPHGFAFRSDSKRIWHEKGIAD